MKNIKIKLEFQNIYIEKDFNSIKELNDYVFNLYLEKKITRQKASELMGVSPAALSQMKQRLKE